MCNLERRKLSEITTDFTLAGGKSEPLHFKPIKIGKATAFVATLDSKQDLLGKLNKIFEDTYNDDESVGPRTEAEEQEIKELLQVPISVTINRNDYDIIEVTAQYPLHKSTHVIHRKRPKSWYISGLEDNKYRQFRAIIFKNTKNGLGIVDDKVKKFVADMAIKGYWHDFASRHR